MTSATGIKHVLSQSEAIDSPWVTAKIMTSPSASGWEKMSAVLLFFNPGQGTRGTIIRYPNSSSSSSRVAAS